METGPKHALAGNASVDVLDVDTILARHEAEFALPEAAHVGTAGEVGLDIFQPTSNGHRVAGVTPTEAPEIKPMEVVKPTDISKGRHAASEVATVNPYGYIGRHRAPEGPVEPEPQPAPEPQSGRHRALVGIAGRHALVETYPRHRSLEEVAGPHSPQDMAAESTTTRSERSKKAASEVGSALTNTFVETYGSIKSGFENTKGTAQEKVGRFKSFLREKALAASTRKEHLVANLKDRRERTSGAIRKGYETSRDQSLRAANIGGEALFVTGLVVAGSGRLGAEAAARRSVRTARATKTAAVKAKDGTKAFAKVPQRAYK